VGNWRMAVSGQRTLNIFVRELIYRYCFQTLGVLENEEGRTKKRRKMDRIINLLLQFHRCDVTGKLNR
jgi:hypothetical protein